MKKIMITFLLLISNLTNAEVYTIVDNASIRGTVLTLAEGEKFESLGAMRKNLNFSHWEGKNIYAYITYGDMTNTEEIAAGTVYFYGPCSLNFNHSNNDHHVFTYKITNLNNTDDSSTSDSKYSVSLNNDGTRLAIGEQQGTNTSTRVYEFNDDNETWEQLGDSVE